MRGHGGRLDLVRTGPAGTEFAILLPKGAAVPMPAAEAARLATDGPTTAPGDLPVGTAADEEPREGLPSPGGPVYIAPTLPRAGSSVG